MRKTLPSAARSGIASASRPFAGAPPRNTVLGGLPVHFGLTPSDRQLAPTGPPLPIGRADRGRCSSQGRTSGGAGSTCHHGPRAGVPGPRGLRLGGGAPAAAAHFRHAALQIRMLARGCTCGSELATRHLRACEGPYASGRKRLRSIRNLHSICYQCRIYICGRRWLRILAATYRNIMKARVVSTGAPALRPRALCVAENCIDFKMKKSLH